MFFFCVSEFLGPIIGSEVYVMTGESSGKTCDYAAYFNFIVFLTLFIFNGGFNVLSENIEFQNKLDVLK